jgi:hypothetical protein
MKYQQNWFKQEELPNQWKESIIISIYKKDDKTDCSNYRGISLLPTSYKMLSNILFSKLSPHVDKIIGDSLGFDVIDQLLIRFFCICQILEKK